MFLLSISTVWLYFSEGKCTKSTKADSFKDLSQEIEAHQAAGWIYRTTQDLGLGYKLTYKISEVGNGFSELLKE